MYPGYNSFPHRPNQVPATPSSRQVAASNPSTGNANNMMPNGMPIQPQLGMFPQNVAALSNLMTQLSNLQSNPYAMQQLMGFSSQNNAQGMNVVPGQFFNMGQSANPMNTYQPPNGNMVPPNMQFCMPNPLQNVNQHFGMQMPNPLQNANQHFGMQMPNTLQNVNQHLGMQMASPSPVPQYNGPPFPKLAMIPNAPRQQLNQGQQNLGSSAMGANGIGPTAVNSQQLQENHAATVNLHMDQAKVSPKFPSSVCPRPQENRRGRGGGRTSNSRFRNSQRNEMTRNPRTEGFQKSRHMQNGKRKFDHADGHRGKETGKMKAQKSGPHNPSNQANERKRFPMIYTAQEIKLWRDGRRKNHPWNTNPKKMGSKVNKIDAKARCEQLKEILAKQAELGVEVAEIPPHYLAESENKKRKHNRRGQKNNRSEATVSPRPPRALKKREPTLLKKLLSNEMRRDKLRLLQVFRFMVTNSFFKNGTELPLKFPSVMVTEDGTEVDIGEDDSENIPAENLGSSIGGDDGGASDGNEDDEEGDDHQDGNDGPNVHQDGEEEGEITD